MPANLQGRAAVGFKIVLNSAVSPEFGNAFWDALRDKKTVGLALDAARKAYNDNNDDSNGFADLKETDCVLVGDPKARLNGVWTGNQSLPPGVWYVEVEG